MSKRVDVLRSSSTPPPPFFVWICREGMLQLQTDVHKLSPGWLQIHVNMTRIYNKLKNIVIYVPTPLQHIRLSKVSTTVT